MSFVLHLAAMAALTITVVVAVQPGAPVPVTVSTELETDAPVVYEPLEISIDPPDVEPPSSTSTTASTGMERDDTLVLTSVAAALLPNGSPGVAPARPSQQPSGSFTELPKNAVQAGSFAAWWIPIPDPKRYGEVVEPGQLPRPGQRYRIHVQVLVPAERKSYRVDDLSGEIVGTDGYKQLIPDRAQTQDENGDVVPAVGLRRSLPIINGVAEIIFSVDAAGKAGIRDTIRIRSNLLDEEQLLTLEFQPAPAMGE